MCGKVRHAIAAVEAGCDIVDRAGHRGRRPHRARSRRCRSSRRSSTRSATACPVVAAGGIFDGRGLAAALALGADGVWVGTRFIATPEARTVPGYKDALLRTPEDGTVISRGVHRQDAARGRATSGRSYIEEHPEELKKFPEQMMRRDGGRTRCTSAATRHAGVDPDQRVLPGRPGRRRDPRAGPGRRPRAPIVAEAERALDRLAAIRAS